MHAASAGLATSLSNMVVCNSVIEPVGNWLDMRITPNEAKRVGKRGWFQTPAFGFPVEQHFLLPVIHWLAEPLQVWLIKLFRPAFKTLSVDRQYMGRPITPARSHARMFRALLPDTEIVSERLVFTKSYVATW